MRLINADEVKRRMLDGCCTMACHFVDETPTASPWHRVEEPPLPNHDLWLHDEHGYYHVGYISTYRGYTEYIDMDGNALHGIDYWMPIEPPQEDMDEERREG